MYHKTTLRFLVTLSCLPILTSCHTIAPGMKIDVRHSCQGDCVESPPYGCLKIVEITPELIDQIEEDRRTSYDNGFCGLFSEIKTDLDYLIGPYDALSIMVWGHPELNNPTNSSANFEQLGFVVNSQGVIYYPYVGEVKVAGLNTDQIRQAITGHLKSFVVNPMVSVNVLKYRSQFVNVIGELNLPAKIPLNDVPITILDAISLAGGATFRGDLQNVVVKRGNELCVFNLLPKGFNSPAALFLMHNDVVYVPNKINNQIYVLGEMLMPQSIVMDSDEMTLSEAIARANGIDPFTANPKLLFVFRENEDGEKVAYHLNAESPAALLLANNFPLKRQDLVYVGTYEPAYLNRIMSNFLSTTRALADLSWSASSINDVINRYNNINQSSYCNESIPN